MKRWIKRVLLSACFLSTPAFAADVDWWKIDTTIARELETKDVGALAKELSADKSLDADAAMRALNVAVRAGHADGVKMAIDRLAEAGKVNQGALTQAAMFLIEREEWALARHFVERFPQTDPGWAYVMIREWSKSGAGHDEIDRWLVARGEKNRSFWLDERVRFRKDQKTIQPLLDDMRKAVAEKPDDVARIEEYIQAVTHAGFGVDQLAGLKDIIKPPTAFETHQIAQHLSGPRPEDALALFERSLAMKFTKADEEAITRLRSMRQSAVAMDRERDQERELRYSTKREMMQLHQQLKNHAAAQKLLVDLADAEKDGIPRGLMHQAGQIQAASGARVIANRIADAPPAKLDTADYWLGRADYFAGRKESGEAKTAYEKALELATRDDERRGKDSRTFKSYVLMRYADLVAATDSPKAAYELIWSKIKDEPLDSVVVEQAVRHIWRFATDGSLPDLHKDDRIWRFMDGRPKWDDPEERVILHMLKHTQGDDRAAVLDRVEALAREKHPSRAQVLGWSLTRADSMRRDDHALRRRAIPWLVDAADRLDDPDKKLSTQFNLFETRLTLGQWKEADGLWPVAKNRLTPREQTSWFSAVAVAAAKAGQKDHAMTIWSRAANLDRTDLRRLDEMMAAGLSKELSQFYDEIAQADPASNIPARAKRMLNR